MTAALTRRLAEVRPRSRDELRGWITATLGINVPDRARCLGHASPMDYLDHVFFERGGDVVVWANRGGGKTFYGAVATLLDLLFKPGISVRILGGSFEQSSRMYSYLRWMLDRDGLRELIDGRVTQRGVRLTNGSEVELLAQAQTSVRGQRVQKLRCDEVELFDRDVWAAAQFVTRSARCGGVDVAGTVEAFSTMHRPYGLMNDLVADAPPAKVMRWCAMDVIDRCEPRRACDDCSLWSACRGRAKSADGFLSVADVIAQQQRSSGERFDTEMLCLRPTRSDTVYPEFSPALHVRSVAPDPSADWIGGIDFGLRSPFVMLWAQLTPDADGAMTVEVVDEYVCRDRMMDDHVEVMRRRDWPALRWVGVDPAGSQRNDQTGQSNIALLRRAGYSVRHRQLGLGFGLEAVRRLMRPAAGDRPRLRVDPCCAKLIESLTQYHFDPDRPWRNEPVKDGHDHAADALRYMVVNMTAGGRVERRWY